MRNTSTQYTDRAAIEIIVSGYRFTHPWYYVRGGSLLPIAQLIALAQNHSGRGYAQDEIEAAGKRKAGARIDALGALHERFKAKRITIAKRYHKAACELDEWRNAGGALISDTMEDVHSNAGYAATQTFIVLHHLRLIERERAGQGDLFVI